MSLRTMSFVAALLACVAQVSIAADAVPPDDEAAAQKLNSAIANCNKSEEDRFQAQLTSFQRDKEQNDRLVMQYQGQNDALTREYDDLRANYVLLEKQVDDERSANKELQLKYQDMQQKLADAQQKYDDIVKAQQTPPAPPPPKQGFIDKLKGVF